MDPLTTGAVIGAVAAYTGQRALDAAVDKLAAAVIRPCAERRAHAYFRRLAEALSGAGAEELDPVAIEALLDAVTKDEAARETVFEYYRQSVLSRSREIGPRLLAVVAARLIRESRAISDEERQISEIAELCTDGDFSEFVAYFRPIVKKLHDKISKGLQVGDDDLTVQLYRDTSDSSNPSGLRSGSINLAIEIGTWAAKLERVGMIEQYSHTSQEAYKEDGERHIDEPGVLTITEWYMHFGEGSETLLELVSIATPASA